METVKRIRRPHSANRQAGVIIHPFAAAHAFTAVATRLLDYYDDIPLTVLTILMFILIAHLRRLSIAITAISTLVVTLLGYLLGIWLGLQLYPLTGSPTAAAAITTFTLTELFGWGFYLLTARFKPADGGNGEERTFTRPIIIAALLILLVRIMWSLFFRAPYFIMHGGVYEQFGTLLSNTFATLTLFSYIAILSSLPQLKRPFGYVLVTVLLLLLPLLPAAIAYYGLPNIASHADFDFNIYAFTGLYSVALLITLITYPAAMLARFALLSRRAMHNERSKKLSEQYKYAKLKQQISPHFLFNSLNILDSLVQNGENERAGRYIRKLASLYRYILKNEEEPLVTLDEELEFTEMYIDLLKVRFADGLFINNSVGESDRQHHIVPCGLQMLIENAIKHNVVSAESPLYVEVAVEGDFISVSNNLQPRISTQPSTRLSLKNLSRQYENIAGIRIEILQSEREFRVRLPLL